MILGTAAYMAPEQAQGRRVDKRADIWAFGVRALRDADRPAAFAGDDVTDTIVAVLSREPDWTALPPTRRRRSAACCAAASRRTPKQRLPDIADARLDIDERRRGRYSRLPQAPAARRRDDAAALGDRRRGDACRSRDADRSGRRGGGRAPAARCN